MKRKQKLKKLTEQQEQLLNLTTEIKAISRGNNIFIKGLEDRFLSQDFNNEKFNTYKTYFEKVLRTEKNQKIKEDFEKDYKGVLKLKD